MDSLNEHWLVVKLEGMLHTTDHFALLDATMQMGLENVVDGKVFGSCAENLKFLFDSLKAGNKEQSKAVIFVLEEFDLFCDHHNQSLLYNLFDVAQSQRVGLSDYDTAIEY
jgi:origin recognition complex subunit 4